MFSFINLEVVCTAGSYRPFIPLRYRPCDEYSGKPQLIYYKLGFTDEYTFHILFYHFHSNVNFSFKTVMDFHISYFIFIFILFLDRRCKYMSSVLVRTVWIKRLLRVTTIHILLKHTWRMWLVNVNLEIISISHESICKQLAKFRNIQKICTPGIHCLCSEILFKEVGEMFGIKTWEILTHKSRQMLCSAWSYEFYDMTIRHWITTS